MKRLLPLVFLALLASCGGTPNEDTYVVKWATPTGAPTLAFYPEAENENWFSSATPATQVLPHFGDNAYDALVFDGTQALTNIKVNKRNYALAKWISGGTFYVVSTKYQASDTAPENPKVMAFKETSRKPSGTLPKTSGDGENTPQTRATPFSMAMPSRPFKVSSQACFPPVPWPTTLTIIISLRIPSIAP